MHLRVLCVDDDPFVRESLEAGLGRSGRQVVTARDGPNALERLAADGPFHLMLTDLRMPKMHGLELARLAKAEHPDLDIILLTGEGRMDDVIEAVRMGVADYIEKPFELDYIEARVRVLEERRALRAENKDLRRQLGERYHPRNMVGISPAIRRVYDLVDRVRDGSATVLIQGESGTGKEVVARAIHFGGARAEDPFVPVDCGAIAENLIERELFGHVKGAFTGAASDQPGLMAASGKGTLFLDEVGELPLLMQAKLLRTLQEREFRLLGSNKTHALASRLLAATNRDLHAEVEERRFREDLYYRLNVVVIEMPPLRERRDDVALLVKAAIERFAAEGARVTGITAEALGILEHYQWPGNVRELENCIEQATALARGELIEPADLPTRIRGKAGASAAAAAADLPPEMDGRSLAAYEIRAIRGALAEAQGNKRKAAAILQISPTTLYAKIKSYAIEA